MNTRTYPLLAALALWALPAAAQHAGHGHAPAAAAGIAEGRLEKGVRVFDLAVTDDGFVPSRLVVNKDEKVRLVVTRKTDATCAKEIVVQGQGIEKPLPLGQAVTVEFTPTKSGEIRYACAMNHVSGIVFVR
jgi:plastocyanin domain-containing protein